MTIQFRRSGQRDDRRRRVLTDALSATAAGSCALPSRRHLGEKPALRKSKNYGDAAFMDQQPRLTDLVPRRLAAYALVLLLGLGAVGGLEVLYAWMPRLAPATTDGRVAAFDLDGEGSLAVWFSSMTLALAGLVAILVFTVRRHRIDDYPGRYRVWLWAAACWFLLSLDETASLHEGFKEMMVLVTGTRVFGDGSIWWAAVYFFLLGAVGTRLLADMRESWLSSTALVGVAACYAVAVAAQVGWVLPESGARGVMLEEGCEMVGNLLLLLAMGLHARHVILDAEGLIAHRSASGEGATDHEGQDEAGPPCRSLPIATEGRSVVVHPPHSVPRPAGIARPAPSRPMATSPAKPALPTHVHQADEQAEGDRPEAGEGSSSGAVRRKLTKAERKALRKRLMQMRAQRERRQPSA